MTNTKRIQLNDTILGKLLDKYKTIKHVYIGYIHIELPRIIKSIEKSKIHEYIPCIIIPYYINTAVITLDILSSFIENTKREILQLVIVNRHGILLLSVLTPQKCIRKLFSNTIFVLQFFKNNHDYKKISRVLKNNCIKLHKLINV